jgi:hypothetical protein
VHGGQRQRGRAGAEQRRCWPLTEAERGHRRYGLRGCAGEGAGAVDAGSGDGSGSDSDAIDVADSGNRGGAKLNICASTEYGPEKR